MSVELKEDETTQGEFVTVEQHRQMQQQVTIWKEKQKRDSEVLTDLLQLCSQKLYSNSIYGRKVLGESLQNDRRSRFERRAPNKVKVMLRAWAASTPIQGPKEIFDSGTWLECTIWLVFCLSMMLCFSVNAGFIMLDFINREVTTSMEFQPLKVDEFKFMYCPSDWMDMGKVKRLGIEESIVVTALILLEYKGFDEPYYTKRGGGMLDTYVKQLDEKTFTKLSMGNAVFNPKVFFYKYKKGQNNRVQYVFEEFQSYLDQANTTLAALLISWAYPVLLPNSNQETTVADYVIRYHRVCTVVGLQQGNTKTKLYQWNVRFVHPQHSLAARPDLTISAAIIPYTGKYLTDDAIQYLRASENERVFEMFGEFETTVTYESPFKFITGSNLHGDGRTCQNSMDNLTDLFPLAFDFDTYINDICWKRAIMLKQRYETAFVQCSDLDVRPYHEQKWNVTLPPCMEVLTWTHPSYMMTSIPFNSYPREPFRMYVSRSDIQEVPDYVKCSLQRPCENAKLSIHVTPEPKKPSPTHDNHGFILHFVRIEPPTELFILKQNAPMSFSTFFSVIGGVTGLYLGSGVFGFVHLVIFSILSCCTCQWLKRSLK